MADAPQNRDPLAYFVAGQQFVPSAATLNAWQQAARIIRELGGTSGGGPAFDSPLKIRIKNSSTGNIGRGKVLKITGPKFNPATNYEYRVMSDPLYLSGGAPTADFQVAAITAEPIPQYKSGRAYLAGLCWAWVNYTEASDKYAYVANAQTGYLKTHPVCGNARILYPSTGTKGSTLAALILLHNNPAAVFPATIKTAWSAGTTADLYAEGDVAQATITATAWGCTFPMDVGAKVLAFYSQVSNLFYFFPMAETTDDVFTDVALDTANDKLQFKKRTIRASFTGAEATGPYVSTTDCDA